MHTERELRDALDDLWGCIAKTELDHLEEKTREVARANHEILWHPHEDPSVIVVPEDPQEPPVEVPADQVDADFPSAGG